MQWEKLLSLKKQGREAKKRNELDQTRLDFDADYDRIVFSDSFRSLQDKTQVLPLSKSGFVHTRLTHSLEVSVVGRSLGRSVGVEILERHPYLQELGYLYTDFGTIVASAALAHDIGNPPFGHSGEKAVGDFFKYKKGKQIQDKVTPAQFEDLCSFEGNANGFRILTQEGSRGSFHLTYATLGSFIKYPKESLPKKPSSHIADKKYNIFQSERAVFQEIAKELELIEYQANGALRYARHPLAFLVEAADDICYTIIDLEDGINSGWITEAEIFPFLSEITQGRLNTEKLAKTPILQDRIAYLRAVAVGALISEAKRIFLENENAILKGEFDCSLLEKSIYKPVIEQIIQMSIRKIYQSPQVTEKEMSGYVILQNLLEIYFTAVMNFLENNATSYDNLLLRTLPEKYFSKTETDVYNAVMGVVCYIASLTDTKVTELHARCIGIVK